ncbi:MAG: hypothetical protein P1U64_11890 [Alcanivoracaceae bacterium]|nr:hypothetical protein [Alcanivoracaceae bacterium]
MKNTENSSFREKLIEHLFIGELLKLSWARGGCTLEVASPEVDNSGYDVIAEDLGVVRHIQLKASYIGGRTATQKVHTRLSDKPSGCVIWIYFDEETLELGPFLYFGSEPGQPLPSLDSLKVARHTRGNQDGYKAERPNIRTLPKGRFEKLNTVEQVYTALFGSLS